MNERIRELIAQAEAYAYEKQPGWTDGPSSYALFREKFAELLIKECLLKVNGAKIRGESMDELIARIKEDFGVE